MTRSKCFGCGPCKKRPGWDSDVFKNTQVAGRSHRSKLCVSLMNEVSNLQREILGVPDDYLIGIINGSDTCAFECSLWNLIGPNGVDCIVIDSFSKIWANDVKNELKIKDFKIYETNPGQMPDIANINGDRDIVTVYNGTTTGVCFDNLDFIKPDRKGLTLFDATSVAFATNIDFSKIDVLTYSWQKVLGGEGGIGILILSPRAIKRLEEFEPENRPMPRVFKIKKDGKISLGPFEGKPVNTISMLLFEDIKSSLLWAKNNGGLQFLINKAKENSDFLYKFIDNNEFLETLCKEKKYRSPTSVCFHIKDKFCKNEEEKTTITNEIRSILEKENVAFDINSYRGMPVGFRIWCGPTVDLDDIKIVCEWIETLLIKKFK